MIYHIRISGALDETWSNWLGDAHIQTGETAQDGIISTLVVDLPDQAALFGVLDHIRDLNLALVSVQRQGDQLEMDPAGDSLQ